MAEPVPELTPEDMIEHMLAHMRNHVMAKIGMTSSDRGEGRSMSLVPSPKILEADGHVDFGVLGVFFDMAASAAFESRGGVHADIAVTRLRPPSGVMTAYARAAREGKRTGVVEVDLRDETNSLVATSTQEIVFREMMNGGPRPSAEDGASAMDQMRERFRTVFDGSCRLDRSLADTLDIVRTDDTWHLELGEDRTNGGGALHGGCAIALVEAAAAGTADDAIGPSRTLSAAVRYLAPARVGPFVARSEVTSSDAGIVVQRVRITDTGQDDRPVILADVNSVAST